MKLYPKNWVVEAAPEAKNPDPEKPSQDDLRILERIRGIVKPEEYSDLVKSIQQDEISAGRHWTNDYLFELIERVRAEFEAEKVD